MEVYKPRSRREHTKDDRHSVIFKIRTILNIVFMAGALAGIIVYMLQSHEIGGAIIIGAMVFKFTECILRLIH